MKRFCLIVLGIFVAVWLTVGGVWLFNDWRNYSKMPMREVTQEFRFFNFKVKKTEILVVHLLAKHDQDFAWLKNNEDYDLISIDKVQTARPNTGGKWSRPVFDEAIKVYLQPKQSFLLNWTYQNHLGEKNILHTKIEVE